MEHPASLSKGLTMVLDDENHMHGADSIILNGISVCRPDVGSGIKISCNKSDTIKIVATGKNEFIIYAN